MTHSFIHFIRLLFTCPCSQSNECELSPAAMMNTHLFTESLIYSLLSVIHSGSHTPVFSVSPLSPVLTLCVIHSYFLSSDTVGKGKYLLTSFKAESVSSGANYMSHLFFFSLPSLLLLMQQDWRISPYFDMQRGCGRRMSKANCWKPLAQNSCLTPGWWFECSFYPFLLVRSSYFKNSFFDTCIKAMTRHYCNNLTVDSFSLNLNQNIEEL